MSIRFECKNCGKKYRLPDESQAKVMTCRDCGKKQRVGTKTKKKTDEWAINDVDLGDYEPEELPPLASPRKRKRKKKKKSTQKKHRSTSDLIIRCLGGVLILASVVNMIVVMKFAETQNAIDKMSILCAYGLVPTTILAILGLVYVIYGEEPDKTARQRNRLTGIKYILGGIGAIVFGAVSLYLIITMDLEVRRFSALFGPILIGAILILYGLLSAVNGRDPREMGSRM